MKPNTATVQITYYSDILCVWAYVAQIRCDELVAEFRERVSLDRRYFEVFGDVAAKIRARWSERGGLAGYAKHVQQVIEGFPHCQAHPELWVRDTPSSSMPAHLVLSAVRRLSDAGEADAAAPDACARAIRTEFFVACADVSNTRTLLGIVERVGVAPSRIEAMLGSGQAHAVFCADLEDARDHAVLTSPTFLFNEDRQRLSGNVGYRILEANVRELLDRPEDESSWC